MRKKPFGFMTALVCGLAVVVITAPVAPATGDIELEGGLDRKRGRISARTPVGDEGAPVPVPTEVALGMDRLRARGLKRGRLSRRTGRAAALYGDLGALADLDAAKTPNAATQAFFGEAAVLAFLGEHADLTGIDRPADELTLERRVDAPGASHFYFRQTVGGLRVFDAETSVHVDRGGRVRAITNESVPGIDSAVATAQPAVDPSGAREAAVRALNAKPAQIDERETSLAELGIAPGGTGRLAWRVFVAVREPSGAWEVFVDASTGAVIGEPRPASASVGRARALVPNAVVATGQTNLADEGDASSAVPASAYSPVDLGNLDASGSLQGTYVTTADTTPRVSAADGDFTALTRVDEGFEEIETYWAIDHAQRYIRESLGITNACDYQIRVDCHYDDEDNSFYRRIGDGRGSLAFGDGGVDDAEDAEIIWHEYGHAVLDNQRPNINLGGEGGAIHEGWGDYLAATLSTTVPGDARFHPTIGEWDAVSYNPGDPAYLRRVDEDKRFPRDVTGQVHADGEIWSACLWDLHRELGRAVADPIIFNANFLFPQDVGFVDAAAAVLESDGMLNGGANAAAIMRVLTERGVAGGAGPPTVAAVWWKQTPEGPKLIVAGTNFATRVAVIYVDGIKLATNTYPSRFVDGGVSTRLVGSDPNLRTRVPRGTPVQVSVLNRETGVYSAPVTFTR